MIMQERWAEPGAETLPNKAYANAKGGSKRFLPFSTGPRQCIGQSLARMMHDVGIAMLMSNFHFQLAPKVSDCTRHCLTPPRYMSAIA